MDQPADAGAVLCDLIEAWAKDRRSPETVQLQNVRGEWTAPVDEFLEHMAEPDDGAIAARISDGRGVHHGRGLANDLRGRRPCPVGHAERRMTDAHDTPPAWLLARARDMARELQDAGEPVTPDAVAARILDPATLTFGDMHHATEWAVHYAAAQVVPDDGHDRRRTRRPVDPRSPVG